MPAVLSGVLTRRLRERLVGALGWLIERLAPPLTDARSIAMGRPSEGGAAAVAPPRWLTDLWRKTPDEAALQRILAFVQEPGDATLEVWITRRRGEWVNTDIRPPRESYGRRGARGLTSPPV